MANSDSQPTPRKTQFYWASIAGADTEPVEVTTLNGERVAYTCGCGDPFYLDKPDCPVVLVADPQTKDATPWFADDGRMNRVLAPKQASRADAAYRRKLAKRLATGTHSWRGPR